MRLKFIACKYTLFIQNRIPARLFFSLFLISHFRDELNTYQTDFLFREVIAQFIKRIISLFRAYINNVSEMKIRSNFSLIYLVGVREYVDVQLLDEVADFGVPVITEPSIMSSLIAVPTTLNMMSSFMNKVVVGLVVRVHVGFC